MNRRSSQAASAILLAGVLAGGPRVAAAEGEIVSAGSRDIVIETPGERSTENKLMLAGLVTAAGIAGGLGLYWHLDSQSASDDVSAILFIGEAWTPDDAALLERADRSRSRAIVAYGVGGALLIGAAIALIVTEPPSETTVIRPRATPTVSPTDGGAVLGGWWSF